MNNIENIDLFKRGFKDGEIKVLTGTDPVNKPVSNDYEMGWMCGIDDANTFLYGSNWQEYLKERIKSESDYRVLLLNNICGSKSIIRDSIKHLKLEDLQKLLIFGGDVNE